MRTPRVQELLKQGVISNAVPENPEAEEPALEGLPENEDTSRFLSAFYSLFRIFSALPNQTRLPVPQKSRFCQWRSR